MQLVYILTHDKITDGEVCGPDYDEEDRKFLGAYSSRASAAEAIIQRRDCEGFIDWPGGFRIEPYVLDSAGLDESAFVGVTENAPPDAPRIEDGTQTIYELLHYERNEVERDSDDFDAAEPRLVGYCSSVATAEEAIARVIGRLEYRNWPTGFEINQFQLDHTGWDGGFFNADEYAEQLLREEGKL